MTTFYYALLLDNGTVLRVATQARSIWNVFLTATPMIAAILALIIVVCVCLAHVLTRQLLQPIEFMAENMEDTTKAPAYKEYAELIENHMVGPEQETRFAQEIQQNSNRLLSLINDIIRLSELDNSESLIRYEQVDLDLVAQECVNNLNVNAQKRSVKLYYEGEPCEIRADRGMLAELVDNLTANAIRYNNEGGEVHVRVTHENMQPVLIVEDNGIGIPKDQQERIFERFYRVDKSRSKQTGGTGLGLAIVKHIVELHDAQITVESEPGKGTTMKVTF